MSFLLFNFVSRENVHVSLLLILKPVLLALFFPLMTRAAGIESMVALCSLDVRNNLLSCHQTLDPLRYLSHLLQVCRFYDLFISSQNRPHASQ